jgi:DNA-binding MarR family transcriptional regulator
MENLRNFRHALRRLENEISINLGDETKCCGVTVSQCHAILELDHMGPSSCLQDLADALMLDKSTLSRIIDSLVRKGWVARDEDPANRRRSLLQLTPEGVQKVAFIHQQCDSSYRKVFNLIPEDKHSQILESILLLSHAMRRARHNPDQSCCSL